MGYEDDKRYNEMQQQLARERADQRVYEWAVDQSTNPSKPMSRAQLWTGMFIIVFLGLLFLVVVLFVPIDWFI